MSDQHASSSPVTSVESNISARVQEISMVEEISKATEHSEEVANESYEIDKPDIASEEPTKTFAESTLASGEPTNADDLTNEWMQQMLKNAGEREDLQVYSFHVYKATRKGDNYFSVLDFVDVETSAGTFSLVIKWLPTSVVHRGMVAQFTMFDTEIDAYETIFPDFQRFIDSNCKSPFRIPVPRLFYSRRIKDQQMLILENVKYDGFSMGDKSKSLNREHCELFLQHLARFHATSYAIKTLTGYTVDPALHHDAFWKAEQTAQFLTATWEDVALLCKALPEIKPYRKRMEKKAGTIYETVIQQRSPKEPLAVVCYGDCWTNNLLFRYEGSRPVDVIMVDWQHCLYSHPVTDVVYFFYTSTTADFRKENLPFLLRTYHTTFLSTISDFGVGIDYPFSRFVAYFKDMSLSGIAIGMFFCTSALKTEEEAVDIENIDDEMMEMLFLLRKEEWEKGNIDGIEKERIPTMVKELFQLRLI